MECFNIGYKKRHVRIIKLKKGKLSARVNIQESISSTENELSYQETLRITFKHLHLDRLNR